MTAAQHHVTDVGAGVTEHDGVAVADQHAADHPGVHPGRLPAPADRIHLQGLDDVGEHDQPGRPGELQAAEVREQPEGEHVDGVVVDEGGELVDLLRREELGLVDDDVVDPRAGPGEHQLGQVGVDADLEGVRGQTDARRDYPRAGPVEPGHQQTLAAACGVGVPVLQHHGALAAVHRRVPVMQLGHRALPPSGSGSVVDCDRPDPGARGTGPRRGKPQDRSCRRTPCRGRAGNP